MPQVHSITARPGGAWPRRYPKAAQWSIAVAALGWARNHLDVCSRLPAASILRDDSPREDAAEIDPPRPSRDRVAVASKGGRGGRTDAG